MSTKITDLTTENTVLATVANRVSFGAIVNNAGVQATNGQMIIPAGTAVGGSANFLEDETAQLSVVSDGSAQGILEHSVDVTDGVGNATVIVEGYVNESKTPAISDAVKKVLPKITFMKR